MKLNKDGYDEIELNSTNRQSYGDPSSKRTESLLDLAELSVNDKRKRKEQKAENDGRSSNLSSTTYSRRKAKSKRRGGSGKTGKKRDTKKKKNRAHDSRGMSASSVTATKPSSLHRASKVDNASNGSANRKGPISGGYEYWRESAAVPAPTDKEAKNDNSAVVAEKKARQKLHRFHCYEMPLANESAQPPQQDLQQLSDCTLTEEGSGKRHSRNRRQRSNDAFEDKQPRGAKKKKDTRYRNRGAEALDADRSASCRSTLAAEAAKRQERREKRSKFLSNYLVLEQHLQQQRRQKGRALGDGVVGSDGFPQRRQDQIKYTDEDEKVAFSSDSDYERVDDGDDGSSVTTFICCYHGYPCELAKSDESCNSAFNNSIVSDVSNNSGAGIRGAVPSSSLLSAGASKSAKATRHHEEEESSTGYENIKDLEIECTNSNHNRTNVGGGGSGCSINGSEGGLDTTVLSSDSLFQSTKSTRSDNSAYAVPDQFELNEQSSDDALSNDSQDGVHPFYNCHEPSRDSLLDMPHSSDSTRYLRALARRRREISEARLQRGGDNGYETISYLEAETAREPQQHPASGPPRLSISSADARKPNDIFRYMGEMTRLQAEQNCRKLCSFRFYHRYPSTKIQNREHLPPVLPLFLVYRTSRGDYCHYRILSRYLSDWPSAAREVKVDIEGEPFFLSLSALADFYSTYVIVRQPGGEPDCFPWWVTSNDYVNRNAIYSETTSQRGRV